MITNFEDYTAMLSTYERDMIVPMLANELKTRVGAKYAIRNKELCRMFNEKGYQKLTEARVRKCINYIRVHGLVPHLIANNRGYFCATSIEQAAEYIFPDLKESEDERIRKWLIKTIHLIGVDKDICADQETMDKAIAWLEKQKEQKPIEFKNDELVEIIKGEFEGFRRLLKKKGIDYEPQYGYWEGFARLFDSSAREYVKEQKEQKKEELAYRLNGLMQEYINEGKDEDEKEHRLKCYQLFWDALEDTNFFEQKEQKHAWSEEDDVMFKTAKKIIWESEASDGTTNKVISWLGGKLRSLRPSWKPSEEQIGTLERICSNLHLRSSDDAPKLDEIIEQLKKLM